MSMMTKKKKRHEPNYRAIAWLWSTLAVLSCIGAAMVLVALGLWLAEEEPATETPAPTILIRTPHAPVVAGTPIFFGSPTPSPTPGLYLTVPPTRTPTLSPTPRSFDEFPLTILPPDDELQIPALSWDGTLLVAGSSQGVRLYDAGAPGRPPRFLDVGESEVTDVEISGNLIAAGVGDGTIRLIEAATMDEMRRLEGHGFPVWDVAFSVDGSLLLSGGDDGTVRLWDVRTGDQLQVFETGTPAHSVAFGADQIAMGGDDGIIRVWNAITYEPIRTFQGDPSRVWSLAYHPLGIMLAASNDNGTVIVWDSISGAEVTRFTGHFAAVKEVIFNPTGDVLASASDDGTAQLWNVVSREGLFILFHDVAVTAVSFSPDGTILATGAQDGSVRWWDTNTGERLRTLPGR